MSPWGSNGSANYKSLTFDRIIVLDDLLLKIKDFDIDKSNAKDIAEFCKHGIADGLGLSRVLKYAYTMEQISKMLGMRFRAVKKQDVENLLIKIEETDYSEYTKHDYKVIVKLFWRWLRKTEHPRETDWFKTTLRKNRIRLPSELLTIDDINRMINFAKNPRDRALIWLLYQSGCRIDEILTLRIKDVSYDEYSAIINVIGKTGARRIRVFDKENYIKFWLSNHKFRDNKESFVFTSVSTNATNDKMDYHSVVSMLKTIAKKCEIKKPVNPHQFRHSRATELSKHLTEAQLCNMFGWKQGSDMPSVYVHLSGRDLDEPLMKLNNAFAENEIKSEEYARIIQEDDQLMKMIADKIARQMKR